MPAPKSMFIAAALALAASWAGGQTVYRCGSSYSQQPCAGARAVDVSDPVTGDAAARAGKAAAADAKRADAMERQRLAREKDAPKAIVIGPATPVAGEKPAGEAGKGKKKKDKRKAGEAAPFTAVGPKPATPAGKKKT